MSTGMLSHIDLTTAHPEASGRFYDRVLTHVGFVGAAPWEDLPGGWTHPTSKLNITLQHARPECASIPHNRYAPGLHHIAFAAQSREEVDRLHDLLVEIGAQVLDPPGEYYGEGYYAVFFADPDGIKLEYVYLSE